MLMNTITPIIKPYARKLSRAFLEHKYTAIIAATIGLAVVMATQYACQPSPRFVPPAPVYLDSITTEPAIRIRIRKNADTVRINSPNVIRIGPILPDDSQDHHRDYHTPVTISMHQNGFMIQPGEGQPVTWDLPKISIHPLNPDTPINFDGNLYPGTLLVHPRHKAVNQQPKLDVINHTMLEDYLPGVVHREIYPDWHPTAFMSQAIAARTYAIEQIGQHRRRHFDLESTQASQAYGGSRTTTRALDAVKLSKGVVLTYNSRILPAYYSSCCGGAGQDASLTFPYGLDVPPLKGTAHDHCKAISPHYNWGPITRDRKTLAKRIAAWASASRHPAASLASINDLRVTLRNAAGRPARFTITDRHDKKYHLNPEEFRFACNYQPSELAPLVKTTRLKSSFVRIHLQSKTVSFTGLGFGHGVGLCQWGMQVMAQRNYDVAAIFSTYYPNASLRRAY